MEHITFIFISYTLYNSQEVALNIELFAHNEVRIILSSHGSQVYLVNHNNLKGSLMQE